MWSNNQQQQFSNYYPSQYPAISSYYPTILQTQNPQPMKQFEQNQLYRSRIRSVHVNDSPILKTTPQLQSFKQFDTDYFKNKAEMKQKTKKTELLFSYSDKLVSEINKFKKSIDSDAKDYCQYINSKTSKEEAGYYRICFEGKNNFQDSFFEFNFIYNNFPDEPPTIQFNPKIQHHNIIPGTGKFCLLNNSADKYKDQNFSMQTIISNVIEQFNTNPDEAEYPVDLAILDLYLSDPVAYKEYIKKLKNIALEIYENSL